MRAFILGLVLCFTVNPASSQPAVIDSLSKELGKTSNDTLRLVLFSRLGDAHLEVNLDSALFYARQYLQQSQKLEYKLNEADALQQVAEYLVELGSSGNALEQSYKALQLLENNRDGEKILPESYLEMLHVSKTIYTYPRYRLYVMGKVNNIIGMTYSNNDNTKALSYAVEAMKIAKSLPADDLLILSCKVLSRVKPDSALLYLQKAYQLAVQTGDKKRMPEILGGIIEEYHLMGDHASELKYMRAGLKFCIGEQRLLRVGYSYLVLAFYFYSETSAKDSAIFFGMKSLQLAHEVRSPYLEFYGSQLLFEMYKAENRKDSAFKYLEMKVAASEKTSSEEKIRQFQNAEFGHQQQQTAIETAKNQFRNKIKIYGLLAGLFVFLLLAIILWRNIKHRQQAFAALQQQKEKTEKALLDLTFTQAQLIQSEKMASLGELTAGIAHEIQNPLNFVNNFSEINIELLGEMKGEIDRGNLAEVKTIANDVIDNEEKINHHGKRADAIVKGMLQHSGSSSGIKEATSINALCDEYLRLAYHGLRAKDKSFNATIKTDFDKTTGRINIVPQDIGRVVLNLINNAFYAVDEKKKRQPDGYEPTVSVSTRKVNEKVEVRVKDNGSGIPQKVVDKIFQPFFTTKPTGQGTGLGLSLSYDMVKAHGGELKVNTKEGEYAEFIIQLPL
ncbi:MAG: HAMP domain-containing sensor histidine kinase [Chitinophagaceae bacterium]